MDGLMRMEQWWKGSDRGRELYGVPLCATQVSYGTNWDRTRVLCGKDLANIPLDRAVRRLTKAPLNVGQTSF